MTSVVDQLSPSHPMLLMQHIASYPDPTLFRGKGSGDHGVFLIGSAKSAVLILARH